MKKKEESTETFRRVIERFVFSESQFDRMLCSIFLQNKDIIS